MNIKSVLIISLIVNKLETLINSIKDFFQVYQIF